VVTVDYVVVGAGYAGLMCGSKLIDRGFRTLIFDMREIGGELAVFSRLSHFRDIYEKYIKKIEELKEEVPVERGTVIKSKPVIVNSGAGLRRYEAKKVILCTGATDAAPPKINILRKRISGVYTLENALRLLSSNTKLGDKILIASKYDEIVKITESQLNTLGYNVELSELDDDFNVIGKTKVEGVEISGTKYKCDTVIIFGGREPFNPLKLRGLPVGNLVACTYDYSKVEENVRSFISKL